MGNAELIACFQDTVAFSKSTQLLKQTKKAIKSNKVYREGFGHRTAQIDGSFDFLSVVSVESDTSLHAAKKYLQYGKTAVLNFANPHYPGGGVQNGAEAQEECLCRSSNLYLCISNQNVFKDYYLYNRNIGDTFFSDRLIYTKDVTVFKDDGAVPKMMPKNAWFQVDVITCAAPYIAKRRYTNRTALKQLFKTRIKNIFEAAIENAAAVIILGAFGCGAFKNPPEVVAEAFREVIEENHYTTYFKRIVFAIKSKDAEDDCCSIFNNTLFFEYMQARFCKEEAPLPLVASLRAKCNDVSYLLNYQDWKRSNKYFGKQFSILGDSISTLAGYNPKGYSVFYSGENCEKTGVRDITDTWWGKVVDCFGGELLVNNSWSGSRVTQLPGSDSLFPSGCSDARTGGLHIRNVMPDVILVYLGINDWANGVPIENKAGVIARRQDNRTFRCAYATMLRKLKANYPNAEIWCCTLCATFMSSKPSFNFPYVYNGSNITAYNQVIEAVAKQYACRVIDLFNSGRYDSIDGTHPNAEGMDMLASWIIQDTVGYEISKLLYVWDDRFMDIEETAQFCVSFGDCPIVHILFDNDKLTVYNSINSRDGYMQFPDHFFEEKTVALTPAEKSAIHDYMKKINLRNWKTDDRTIELYEGGADGFCINDSLTIDFKNGKRFTCYEPKTKEFDRLVDFMKGFCDASWFEPFYDNDDNNENAYDVLSEKKYDADADYVLLDMTWQLFDTNQLKLHDAAAKQGIELQGDYLAVGRRSDCALQIDNTCISQIHAAFYYEGTGWFIMDKNSLNGTWLNGKKLKQNTKYELFPGDVLSFAKAKEYVFYDDKPREPSEAEARGISEKENEYNVGSVLNNRYKLVKEVGGGGLSTVYLALDTTADKFWAVKLVKTEAAGNARQIRDSVLREAKMMQSFAHPAIPKVADILDTAEYAAIVMEYIEGETLENVVKTHGAQPVESVTAWALQLCDVLGYLHAQNPPVIYRDMKPANIILKPDGNISILDFGIMRTYKPNQKADTACLGTAGFAAPEQYGTAQTDCRSDIYALGMTMYNLCSGIRPTGKSGVSFGNEKDRLNKFFISIIKKCTALNPADRYPSCAALAKDLRIVWETGRAKEKCRRFKT